MRTVVSSSRAGASALLLALLPCLAAAQDANAAGDPPPIHRVLPDGRASQDARLSRPARTTDTPVEWTPPLDPIEWLERAKALRTRIELSGRLFPYPGANLDDEPRASIEREDYTVSNVLFQTYFFQYVPGNLYRSKVGPELRPLVVVPHGHWEGGRMMQRSDEEAKRLVEAGLEERFEAAKYPLQALCAGLARLGFDVLVYDRVGYGELTDWDHQTSFGGVEDVLRLRNLFAFELWNTFMALTYAWNQEGVDERRVAFVGPGDAGAMALLFAAIDPRIKATFAGDVLAGPSQGECRCLNPSHLHVGTSNLELAATVAPRALAFTAGDAVREPALAKLRSIWGMLGTEEDVVAREVPSAGEGPGLAERLFIYEFLNDALELGHEGPFAEWDFEPVSPEELRVYAPGGPRRPAMAKSPEEVFAGMDKAYQSQRDLLFVREDPSRVKVFRGVLLPALGTMLDVRLPAPDEVAATSHGSARMEGAELRKLTLARAGSGEELPAVLVVPDEWNGDVLIGVAHDGKQHFFGGGDSSFADAARVVRQGVAFLAPDVLLTGEHTDDPARAGLAVDEARHARYAGYTYGYNRTLLGERVQDLLTTIAYARSLEGVRRVNLVGTGDAGPWALMARALVGTRDQVGDAIDRTAAQWSWDFDLIRSADDQNFLPGALRYGGLDYFTALIAPAPLRLAGSPRETFPMPIPETTAKAYRSLGELDEVRTVSNAQHAAVLDWLAGGAEN